MSDELIFLPLGGSNEIGMNLNLYGFGAEGQQDWIMVDLGITFGDDRQPGIDVITPDPTFIADRKNRLLGIVLTHGHEDHIGAVAHLWPLLEAPIYATPFTAELVKGKLKEKGIWEEVDFHVIELGSKLTLGPFDMELVTLTHSIPEPNAIAITTPLGTVMHTGDWKIDPDPLLGEVTDDETLRRYGDAGILAMICDSTNVLSHGRSGSEGEVKKSIIELIKGLTGRIAVTTFASNVARVETLIRAAAEAGRHPVLVGRSMHRIVAAARETGYLHGLPNLIDEREAGHLPRDKVMFICTGSQGEGRAALAKIAYDDHPNVVLDAGDTVIFSSRQIPGNEKDIFALQNQLADRGINIITEKEHFVHVSGHPCRDELAEMYQWVRPQIAVPVHGERRHLMEHAKLAQDLQIEETVIPHNGAMVRLAPGPAKIVDEVPSGRLYLDGDVLISSLGEILPQRKRISFNGFIGATLTMDEKNSLVFDPALMVHGVPLTEHDSSFEGVLIDLIDATLGTMSKRDLAKDDVVAEKIRVALRRFVRLNADKKPIVHVIVQRLIEDEE